MDSNCESLGKKMIGKSRLSGRKLNVRFDEGELEIEPSATTPALYSTKTHPFFKKSYYDIMKTRRRAVEN